MAVAIYSAGQGLTKACITWTFKPNHMKDIDHLRSSKTTLVLTECISKSPQSKSPWLKNDKAVKIPSTKTIG